MAKFILFLFVLEIALIPGCNRNKSDDLNTTNQASVYLQGTPLQLNDDEILSIMKQADNAIAEGEILHSVSFSSEMIDEVREKEQVLEISFHENRFVMTDKEGKIEFRNVMIPLTGEFAQQEKFVVFYGTSGYNETPILCSSGYKELQELLIGLIN